jgi:hypothetical protein
VRRRIAKPEGKGRPIALSVPLVILGSTSVVDKADDSENPNRGGVMAKISDRDWQAYVQDLRDFEAARDRYRRDGLAASHSLLDHAEAALIRRVGEGDFPSIVACLDMRGNSLIEKMAALSADELPDLTGFRQAIECEEARQIFDECIGIEIEPARFLAVLHGYANAKDCGRDLFAEHGQDTYAVIRSLLDDRDD